jgi:hypothetical protein
MNLHYTSKHWFIGFYKVVNQNGVKVFLGTRSMCDELAMLLNTVYRYGYNKGQADMQRSLEGTTSLKNQK